MLSSCWWWGRPAAAELNWRYEDPSRELQGRLQVRLRVKPHMGGCWMPVPTLVVPLSRAVQPEDITDDESKELRYYDACDGCRCACLLATAGQGASGPRPAGHPWSAGVLQGSRACACMLPGWQDRSADADVLRSAGQLPCAHDPVLEQAGGGHIGSRCARGSAGSGQGGGRGGACGAHGAAREADPAVPGCGAALDGLSAPTCGAAFDGSAAACGAPL